MANPGRSPNAMKPQVCSNFAFKRGLTFFSPDTGTGQQNTMYSFVKSGQALPTTTQSAPVKGTNLAKTFT